MNDKNIIGVDLGGTNIRAGIVSKGELTQISADRIPSEGTAQEVLDAIFRVTDQLMRKDIDGIGIGVPSVVDIESGTVYDVQNIPSWKEVPLRNLVERKYRLPVVVNNDANCFALGEKYFGKGREVLSFVGLIIGTGMGAGIIINDKLYPGLNSGAGEFGNVDYLDKNFEYYASGQFFENCYHTEGEAVFKKALNGDPLSILILEELGTHIGNAIKMVLYTYCPQLVILGGSVAGAYDFFEQKMWKQINTYVYGNTIDRFKIEVSDLQNSAVLGAASLYFDSLLV